jgi:hypothetical protein
VSLYSSIDRRINGDTWFRKLSHDAQLVWFRLLTGPHVTPVAGLWPAREGWLADEFGYSTRQFREHFAEITREKASNGLPRAVADWDAGVLWLPNAIKADCNQPKNWRVLRSWLNYLELVPECELSSRALQQFADWINSKGNSKRFSIAKDKPNPILVDIVNCWRNGKPFSPTRARAPEQEQEQEREQEQEIPAAADLRFADSDQEKPIHPDFELHPLAVSELAKAFSVSEDVIRDAVREFVGYWTIGGGMGKARAHWQRKCRDDIRRKHASGDLARMARDRGEEEPGVIVWDQ